MVMRCSGSNNNNTSKNVVAVPMAVGAGMVMVKVNGKSERIVVLSIFIPVVVDFGFRLFS